MPITELSHPAAKKSLIIRLEIFLYEMIGKETSVKMGYGL